MSLFANYKFVQIPSSVEISLKEIEESSQGGLEADSLQKHAKLHFSSPVDSAIRANEVREQLESSKIDKSAFSEDMMQNIRNMGPQVEIISLFLPSVPIYF